MSSSWPIVLGVFALVVAAFWYDASNASASASGATPANVAATAASVPGVP